MTETLLLAAVIARIVHTGEFGPTATFEVVQNGHEIQVEAVYKEPGCDTWVFELPGVDLTKGCARIRAQVWDGETPSQWSNQVVRCVPEPSLEMGLGVGVLALLTLAGIRGRG